MNDDANENNGDHYRKRNGRTTGYNFFQYKTKIFGNTPADSNTLDTEVIAPLKYLSYFWRFLGLLLFNCKIEHGLSWSRKFVTSEIYKTSKVPANPDANPPNVHNLPTITSDATFQINSAKLYLSVVTLSINIKQGFK